MQQHGGNLRPRQAAQYLGIGLSTLYKKASTEPDFPKLVQLGPGITVVSREALDRYVEAKASQAGDARRASPVAPRKRGQ